MNGDDERDRAEERDVKVRDMEEINAALFYMEWKADLFCQ